MSTSRVARILEGDRPQEEILDRIVVPVDVRDRESQRVIGERFDECFRSGLAVVGFERGESAGTYLLGKWQSE